MTAALCRPTGTLTAIFCLLYLVGCSTASRKEKAFDEEKLLVSAGFTYKVADTANKIGSLKSLPQRKLLRQARQGKVTYLYADVASCNCVYVGNEAAYQRLKRLTYDEKLTDKQDKGIWSTTRISEAAELGPFLDLDEFAGDPDAYLED